MLLKGATSLYCIHSYTYPIPTHIRKRKKTSKEENRRRRRRRSNSREQKTTKMYKQQSGSILDVDNNCTHNTEPKENEKKKTTIVLTHEQDQTSKYCTHTNKPSAEWMNACVYTAFINKYEYGAYIHL